MEEFLPSFPNARGRITWRDMLCMTPLKAGLPVAVRLLFSFIAVAASEIFTVSNSSFISFWRSFRGIVWKVLWTLKLTQSQVGIVGLKIVNSFIESHKSLRKIQKTEQITRDFSCIFYRFVDFLTLNTLTQLYLKNLYTFRTNIVSRSYRIIKGLAPTVIRIWLCFGQRSRFFARF